MMSLEERLQRHIGEQAFTIAQLQVLLEQANAKIVELQQEKQVPPLPPSPAQPTIS